MLPLLTFIMDVNGKFWKGANKLNRKLYFYGENKKFLNLP